MAQRSPPQKTPVAEAIALNSESEGITRTRWLLTIVSSTSVCGVIGKTYAMRTPASSYASAMASAPVTILRWEEARPAGSAGAPRAPPPTQRPRPLDEPLESRGHLGLGLRGPRRGPEVVEVDLREADDIGAH